MTGSYCISSLIGMVPGRQADNLFPDTPASTSLAADGPGKRSHPEALSNRCDIACLSNQLRQFSFQQFGIAKVQLHQTP